MSTNSNNNSSSFDEFKILLRQLTSVDGEWQVEDLLDADNNKISAYGNSTNTMHDLQSIIHHTINEADPINFDKSFEFKGGDGDVNYSTYMDIELVLIEFSLQLNQMNTDKALKYYKNKIIRMTSNEVKEFEFGNGSLSSAKCFEKYLTTNHINTIIPTQNIAALLANHNEIITRRGTCTILQYRMLLKACGRRDNSDTFDQRWGKNVLFTIKSDDMNDDEKEEDAEIHIVYCLAENLEEGIKNVNLVNRNGVMLASFELNGQTNWQINKQHYDITGLNAAELHYKFGDELIVAEGEEDYNEVMFILHQNGNNVGKTPSINKLISIEKKINNQRQLLHCQECAQINNASVLAARFPGQIGGSDDMKARCYNCQHQKYTKNKIRIGNNRYSTMTTTLSQLSTEFAHDLSTSDEFGSISESLVTVMRLRTNVLIGKKKKHPVETSINKKRFFYDSHQPWPLVSAGIRGDLDSYDLFKMNFFGSVLLSCVLDTMGYATIGSCMPINQKKEGGNTNTNAAPKKSKRKAEAEKKNDEAESSSKKNKGGC